MSTDFHAIAEKHTLRAVTVSFNTYRGIDAFAVFLHPREITDCCVIGYGSNIELATDDALRRLADLRSPVAA